MHVHHDTTTQSGHGVPRYYVAGHEMTSASSIPTEEVTPMLMRLYAALQSRDDGATMVEYGLMVVFIAVVALVAVTAFGGSIREIFQNAADLLSP